MGSISVIDRKIIFNGTFDENVIAKSVPGAHWDSLRKNWWYQLEKVTIDKLMEGSCHIVLHDSAKRYLSGVARSRAKYLAYQSEENPFIDSDIADLLYDYQKKGVNYMSHLYSCINADDMGLGKTLQAIATICQFDKKRILVVCPNSLKRTWQTEIIKWTGRNSLVYNPTHAYDTRGKGIFIINYESTWVRPDKENEDKDTVELNYTLNGEWDMVFFDEAHRLKNRKAKHTKACKMIKSEHKYALTGTPMENSPDELWSILNLLFPDRFNSYWRFVEQWCSVECGVTPQGKEYRKVTGCSNPKGLHDMLAPLMIRRLKENVLEELPQKVRSTISVDLLPKDRSIYTKLQKEMIAELPSGEIVITPNIISMITRLRQVSISHSLLSSEDKNVKSAKITAAMDLINDNKISHKVLVFSRFNEAIKLLKLSLDKEKVRYVEITGNVPADKRKDAENRFQNDPNIRVIVGTIGAMGEGYTLTAGDIVIFLDKHDNPQKNKQAEDRAYRIGQVNMVNIISLIASDTWEELVEAKLQMKLSMSDEVIDGIKCEGHLYSDVLAESLHEIRSL